MSSVPSHSAVTVKRPICVLYHPGVSGRVSCCASAAVAEAAAVSASSRTNSRCREVRTKVVGMSRVPSENLDQQHREQAQHDAARKRDEPVTPEQPEAKVARQLAEAEFLEPRPQPAEQQQREEDDKQPADHSVCVLSPCMKPIASCRNRSSQPFASPITLNSSPISCSISSFCVFALVGTSAPFSSSTMPQLIRKCACEV